MGANCFLVRYAGGWAERKSSSSISTYGRQEALLGLGSLTSLSEVNRVADGQLDDFATPSEQTDVLLEEQHAEPFVMRGRAMDGWLRVDADGVTDEEELERWVRRGVAYARTLPPK